MPPSFIQIGPMKNQGFEDVVGDLLKERLTDYEHHRIVTNVVRHFDTFKQGEKVCGIGLYRTTERESFLYFSIPAMLTLPPVLILRKDKLAQLGTDTIIGLETILANEEFRLGLSKDRSYGQTLDNILRRHAERKNLVLFSGQELGQNYFKMLMLDRLDGLLALPSEAMYHAEQLGIRDQIATLLLQENQGNYESWYCAIACPKNEWGREVIDKINTILMQIRPSERYRQAYERWLDGNSLQRYRTIYNDVFLATKP